MSKTSLNPGERRSIALRDLEPHPIAQRRLDPNRVNDLASRFDPALIGEITVTQTKRGKLWVVNGQHRVAAALQWLDGDGRQCVECKVIPVADEAEAGRLFLGLNDAKAVPMYDRFAVRVVARDPIATGVVAVLEQFNLRVGRAKGPNIVLAVGACEAVFARQRGAQLLSRTIGLLHRMWGSDPDAYAGQLIRGVSLLLIKHGDVVNEDDFVRKIVKARGPLKWLARGREFATSAGCSVAQGVYDRMRDEYNKGRRSGALGDKAAA